MLIVRSIIDDEDIKYENTYVGLDVGERHFRPASNCVSVESRKTDVWHQRVSHAAIQSGKGDRQHRRLQSDRKAIKQRGGRAGRQAGRQAGKQAGRQAGKQAGRQAGRQLGSGALAGRGEILQHGMPNRLLPCCCCS